VPTYYVDLTALNTLARSRGVGRYAHYLARGLSKLVPELDPGERLVAIVGLRGRDVFSDDLRPESHLGPLPPLAEQGAAYDRYWRDRWLFLRRALQKSSPDVVHFIEGPAALPATEYRSIVTCHDIIPLLMPALYLPKLTEEPVRRAKDYLRYKTAQRVIAVSNATAHDLATDLGVPEGRISVVHEGVDHDTFHPAVAPGEVDRLAKRYGVPARYGVYLGAHDPRKRVALLVTAWRAVFKATGVPLVLAGAWHGPMPDDVREALQAMPAGGVLRIGEVDAEDVPALYRHALVHPLPSIYEGFGLTVLEAMASGCPVVTTRGGSLPEAGGEAALYVRADDLTELEDAILSVIGDATLRDRMRERGLAHAGTFTWERCARATLDAYRLAAGYRPKARAHAGALS
jgi:glycosyltransferase involved in cell wall biosynthesis